MLKNYKFLLAGILYLSSLSAHSTGYPRYVIVSGEHTGTESNPDYLDLRPNDINRHMYIWENTATGSNETDHPYEGASYLKMTMNSGWFGCGFVNDQPVDFSAFARQDFILHFAIKSEANCPFFIKLEAGSYPGYAKVDLKGKYDFPRDGQWHVVEIPMRAFFAQGIQWKGLMSGKNYFTLITEQAVPGQSVSLDYIYFHTGIREDGSRYIQEKGEIDPSNPAWFIVAAEHTNIEDNPAYVDLRPDGTTIQMYIWENTAVGIEPEGEPFEGASYSNLRITAPAGWFGCGFVNSEPIDFSAFSQQPYTLHFALKTTSYMPLFVKLEGLNNTSAIVYLNGKYNFIRDGKWQEIQISLSDFTDQGLQWNGNMSGRLFFSLVSEQAEKNVSLGFDDVYFAAGDPVVNPNPRPVDPATLPDYVIVSGEHTHIADNPSYLDLRPNGSDIQLNIWENTATGIEQDIPAYEGEQYPNFRIDNTWFGLGFINDDPRDFTCFAYKDFVLHFAIKTTSATSFFVKLEGKGEAVVMLTGEYDFPRDGNWHKIEIPMSRFFDQGLVWDGPMAKKNYFTLISENAIPGDTFGLDYIYFYKVNQESGLCREPEIQPLTITRNDGYINVLNTGHETVHLYSLQGASIRSGQNRIPVAGLSPGMYIVRVGNQCTKIIIP